MQFTNMGISALLKRHAMTDVLMYCIDFHMEINSLFILTLSICVILRMVLFSCHVGNNSVIIQLYQSCYTLQKYTQIHGLSTKT